jgi:hypothetical protein
MTEQRSVRRYGLALPVIIRMLSDKKSALRTGKTRDLSTNGVYFTVNQKLSPGAEIHITLTMPSEVSRGSDVSIRARGRVVRVDKKPAVSSFRIGVAAVIERFEIIRTKPAIV